MRRSVSQKGAKHQNTSGRGCAWYAGPSSCYGRSRGRLHASWRVDKPLQSRCPDCRQRLRYGRDCSDCGGGGNGDCHSTAIQSQTDSLLRPTPLQAQILGRKCLPENQGMARYFNTIRKACCILPSCRAPTVRNYLGIYLVTTLSNRFAVPGLSFHCAAGCFFRNLTSKS